MYLYRIVLNPRLKEVRRDVADAYQMHSTLCRAFCQPEEKCKQSAFLWRLELERGSPTNPVVLVLSKQLADWKRITLTDWLVKEPEGPIDLNDKYKTTCFDEGRKLRFRLKANACYNKDGKRHAVKGNGDQLVWLRGQAAKNGFLVLSSVVTLQETIKGYPRDGKEITVFSVQYDGMLQITDRNTFIAAMNNGIGHGKALGLGLLTAVPQ